MSPKYLVLLGIITLVFVAYYTPDTFAQSSQNNTEYSVFESERFAINYPKEWSTITDYEFATGERGLLVLDDEKNHNVQLSVRQLQDELAGYFVTDPQYTEDMARIHKSDCVAGEESVSIYGYGCSDFNLLESKTIWLNEKKAHQITYSWTKTSNSETKEMVSIATEIPSEPDVWVIYAETIHDTYPSYWKPINEIISSFQLKPIAETKQSQPKPITERIATESDVEKTNYFEIAIFAAILIVGIIAIARIRNKSKRHQGLSGLKLI